MWMILTFLPSSFPVTPCLPTCFLCQGLSLHDGLVYQLSHHGPEDLKEQLEGASVYFWLMVSRCSTHVCLATGDWVEHDGVGSMQLRGFFPSLGTQWKSERKGKVQGQGIITKDLPSVTFF